MGTALAAEVAGACVLTGIFGLITRWKDGMKKMGGVELRDVNVDLH